jgi:hypothetical protein
MGRKSERAHDDGPTTPSLPPRPERRPRGGNAQHRGQPVLPRPALTEAIAALYVPGLMSGSAPGAGWPRRQEAPAIALFGELGVAAIT